jgi:uncharacterized protein
MAKQGQTTTSGGLDGLVDATREFARRGPAPVHLWNPPFCGDIDMRIAPDGTWFYLGTPIGRPGLVRLFSSILKREGDAYFLVTPVEKIGIRVDDAPFLAVEMKVEGEGASASLHFRTNVDDWVLCDATHGLRFDPAPAEGLTPYLHVRNDLWAKVTRPLYYDLVERARLRMIDGKEMLGVTSSDAFFTIAPAETAGDLS